MELNWAEYGRAALNEFVMNSFVDDPPYLMVSLPNGHKPNHNTQFYEALKETEPLFISTSHRNICEAHMVCVCAVCDRKRMYWKLN